MVKVIDKINESIAKNALAGGPLDLPGPNPFFSLEFFPPKTEEGKENLYMRMER